jgi:hypothetical protein
MVQPDGLLGSGTGWQLTERKLPFCHSYRTNAGEEIDFLVEQPTGIMIIECKMHKLRGTNLPSELTRDLVQLQEHLKVAARASLPVASAMCVVNVPAKILQELIPIAAQQSSSFLTADEFATMLCSYQEFPTVIDLSHADARNRELANRLVLY